MVAESNLHTLCILITLLYICMYLRSNSHAMVAKEEHSAVAFRFPNHGKLVYQGMTNSKGNRDETNHGSVFQTVVPRWMLFVTDQSRPSVNQKTSSSSPSFCRNKKPQRSPRRDRTFIPLITAQSFRSKKSMLLRRRVVSLAVSNELYLTFSDLGRASE